MKLKPLYDRVVLRPIKKEDTRDSGILLAEMTEEKPSFAKVVAVGDGINIDGAVVPLQVKVDDEVVYSKFAGVEYKIDGESFVIVRQADILAIVKKEVNI